AETAGDLGDVVAEGALERALVDVDDAVRAYAANALGRIASADPVHLQRRLSAELSPRVRFELLIALRRHGVEVDLSELTELVRQTSERDADAILNALADWVLRPAAQRANAPGELRAALAALATRAPHTRYQVEQITAQLDE